MLTFRRDHLFQYLSDETLELPRDDTCSTLAVIFPEIFSALPPLTQAVGSPLWNTEVPLPDRRSYVRFTNDIPATV